MTKKQRTLRSHLGLRWCPCVGHRLAHRDCRIYTNRRWGVKVKVHVQTFGQRNLMLPDPRSLQRWAERGQRFMPESTAESMKHYSEAQARVAAAVRRNYLRSLRGQEGQTP